ncbi:hypothetical protein Tsubulata_041708 [Turnera subulata]|uniref:Transmembrane protein n=1 Tax=Turnera subulata TaxID=218843 RepID=A0A9Q0F6X6_9ROSI|nr:hypothetical protein Tsubulata_041708 [Turnera subulata]
MAFAFIYALQNLWPLSIFKFDDLRASNELVKKLPIPENTKRFVFAARDPESKSVGKEKYENVAGNLVLREIFGVGFHEHVLVARRAAKEVGSSFLVLETPSCGRRMVKLLASYMDGAVPKLSISGSDSGAGLQEVQPMVSSQVPPFAQSIYPLLVDLYDIFSDIPSIGRALACSQKMFYDVSRGEAVDARVMSEVYTFQIAVEGLRIALNNAGRLPIKDLGRPDAEFSELPIEDKSYALLAGALQSQTRKFKSMVAVVDASGLAGLRKHWKTPLPEEVKDLVEQLVTNTESDGEVSGHSKWQRLFPNKPVVAVGAGATAALGVASIPKFIPASTFIKIATFKLPASLKLMLTQTQKVTAMAFGNPLGSSKLVVPVLTNSGANATSFFKAAASAEKIRTVVHSVIASVEKTSISAMRTAFYEIMRKRQVQSIGFLPWATFGGSMATCSALLMYGDGIEFAVESLPAAPSIASLGRGIQSLRQASLEVKKTDSSRIQQAIESLMHRFRKVKIQ